MIQSQKNVSIPFSRKEISIFRKPYVVVDDTFGVIYFSSFENTTHSILVECCL